MITEDQVCLVNDPNLRMFSWEGAISQDSVVKDPTKTQHNLNTAVGLDMNMTLHTTHHHRNSTAASRTIILSKPQPNLNTRLGLTT